MSLLINFITLLGLWRPVFCKGQLFERARALAIGFLGTIGRKTISNVAICLKHANKGYEADCAVFSRRKWEPTELFDPLLKEALTFTTGPYICVAADDTTLKKNGKKIKNAGWRRDSLSPPFHVNFIWGLRFLQFSLLLEPSSSISSRAIPIDFVEAPCLKKPSKKASEAENNEYKENKKKHNLSTLFVSRVKKLRERVEALGINKTILMTCDASFCNRICMRDETPGVEKLCRCRKDAKLCLPYQGDSKRKKYADEKFTPEEIRKDKTIPWKTIEAFYGGKMRTVRYKEVNYVLWQRGSGTRSLKLIILAPTPYQKRKKGKVYYRDPAYLLCTDVEGDIVYLIQCYLNRWQIEVNFREEKSILGVGEAQVTNAKAVERQPAFHIAVYSALLLAARKTYNDKPLQRDNDDPKWRKTPRRLTFCTMMGLLRAELIEHPEIILEINISLIEIATLLKKAA